MDIERFIGLAFTGFFVIILFFIIIRSLFLMSRDMGAAEEVKEKSLRLTILKSGENRSLKEGGVISIVDETTFGRKNDNTIVLTDPYVSGYHFRIFPKDGRFVIEDNQSTNGTLLNGEKLEMKTYLKKEDIIKVGNLTLKVYVS
jgi:pSer/pThr/pTyr-binding forkhead associated (FHA) protein